MSDKNTKRMRAYKLPDFGFIRESMN